MRSFNRDTTIKVKRNEIIDTLDKFRKAHVREYAEAIEEYRRDLVDMLEQRAHEIVNDPENESLLTIPHNFNMKRPINAEEEYEKMINVFTAVADQTVRLTVEEVNNIFNDDWSWVQEAKIVNTTYIKGL